MIAVSISNSLKDISATKIIVNYMWKTDLHLVIRKAFALPLFIRYPSACFLAYLKSSAGFAIHSCIFFITFYLISVSHIDAVTIGKIYEIGSTGISSLGGHTERRTECVNRFVAEFGGMPLVSTSVKAIDSRGVWFWWWRSFRFVRNAKVPCKLDELSGFNSFSCQFV